jgi:hypothetical protein
MCTVTGLRTGTVGRELTPSPQSTLLRRGSEHTVAPEDAPNAFRRFRL